MLGLSGYKMNSDTGLMTTITVTLALVMDFLFLPCLLMRLYAGRGFKISPVEIQGYTAP
jgi:predicted RND superfamily exporter protein